MKIGTVEIPDGLGTVVGHWRTIKGAESLASVVGDSEYLEEKYPFLKEIEKEEEG